MTAIYVRQSVDKKDSISIETQIEECKRKLGLESEPTEVFSDKGFSGKSTNRPEFRRMFDEVRGGGVTKIIVYKLDRISRSLIDFLKIEEELERRGVAFVSCKEEFDTSTPMGKMMLHILMVFAEMERETIQKRITDNYYARGEKGFYLGGYAPFGYNKVPIIVDGKKTYTYEINPEEAKLVRLMYFDYANDNKSLNAIARNLNEMNIATRKGKAWCGNTVSGILTNPVFAKADADVYNFLKSLKATLNNPIEDYVGANGCIAYGNVKSRAGAKFKTYENQFVTLGLHEGVIDPDLWLRVQFKFKERSGHTNLGQGKSSWLQGLIKCGSCGLSMYVKSSRNKDPNERFGYIYCKNKASGACLASRKMLRADFLENEVEKALLEKLKACRDVTIAQSSADNAQSNALKIELDVAEKKIENLINSIADGSDVAIRFINQAIERLSVERDEINSRLLELQLRGVKSERQPFSTADITENWENYAPESKKRVARNIIKAIKVNGYDIEILFY